MNNPAGNLLPGEAEHIIESSKLFLLTKAFYRANVNFVAWAVVAHPEMKCLTCKGIGMLVRSVPSKLYKCGFVDEAYTCPDCLGSGMVMPQSIDPARDRKMAAAGGDR